MPLSPENFQQQLSNSFFDTARQRCDREGDEVLNTLIAEQGKKEALRLFDLLIQNIELPLTKLPEEIRQFITNHRQLPDWADARQIRLAQELFADHGPKFLLFLFYKSLPILYACKNGAQVLVQTGRLAHQSDSLAVFNRRIAETGQFLINICPSGSVLYIINRVFFDQTELGHCSGAHHQRSLRVLYCNLKQRCCKNTKSTAKTI